MFQTVAYQDDSKFQMFSTQPIVNQHNLWRNSANCEWRYGWTHGRKSQVSSVGIIDDRETTVKL